MKIGLKNTKENYQKTKGRFNRGKSRSRLAAI
ncbi:hypothetical protein HNP70_000881 [Borreliella kurtenbachii]